jgi:hypothetical protein
LVNSPPFLILTLLICLYAFAITVALTFAPAYLIRVQGLGQGSTGLFMAVTVGLLGMVAVLIGGKILARSRLVSPGGPVRLTGYVAIGVLILHGVGILASGWMAITCLAIGIAAAPIANSAIISSAQELVPSRARATAIALMFIPDTIIGSGGGGLITGRLSDALMVTYGQQSIRYAMAITCLVAWGLAIPSYFAAGRLIERASNRPFERSTESVTPSTDLNRRDEQR